jgi:glycosyltransferase involved in cell wall biosynthesis
MKASARWRDSVTARGSVRVARVIARLNVGGPALHVAVLTARLPAPFESRLFAGGLAAGEAEMSDVLSRENVEPVRVHGLGRAIRPSDDFRALCSLIGHFRAFRPHIVHTHTAKAGTLGRIAARLCGVPVVVHTFHGHVFDGYFSPAVTGAVIAVERAMSFVTTRTVTISQRQFDDITNRFRIAEPERVTIIPLGFDLRRFDGGRHCGTLRAELGLAGEPIVSIVGRLTPIKDHAILFEAFHELGDSGAHLCVVGGGECESTLRATAERLGIAPRTHFLGFRTDLESILSDTDVVALTSRNEGTPVALIEALAAGCRAVSFDVGGVADVLEDGRWGRVVERTKASLVDALKQEIGGVRAGQRDSERCDAARVYVNEKYGVSRLINDHADLYRSLLRENPNLG